MWFGIGTGWAHARTRHWGRCHPFPAGGDRASWAFLARWVGVVCAPCARLARGSGAYGSTAIAWHGGQWWITALPGQLRRRWDVVVAVAAGTGGVGWRSGGHQSGGPAALMDRPMMRPAHQRQVGQIGRATMQPMPQMMRLTPSQRPRTAGEHTATITHRQDGPLGGPTTRLARPTSNGWVGAPPRTGVTTPPRPAAAPPSPRRRRWGRGRRWAGG